MFTDINESEKYQVLRNLLQGLFSCYLRIEGQTDRQTWWNWDMLLWILSYTQRYRLLQLLQIISEPSYSNLCFGVPGSCLAFLPLSSALNNSDVSQCQGHPAVRHTQIWGRMGCTGIMDVLVLLLRNWHKWT